MIGYKNPFVNQCQKHRIKYQVFQAADVGLGFRSIFEKVLQPNASKQDQTGQCRSYDLPQIGPGFTPVWNLFIALAALCCPCLTLPYLICFEFFALCSQHVKTSQRCIACHRLLKEPTATAHCASSSSASSFDLIMYVSLLIMYLCLPIPCAARP